MTDNSSTDSSDLRGPWDGANPPDDEVVRVDFGSLLVPGVEGMNINIEVDEQSQAVVGITLIIGQGGMQLQPFAAPRSGDFWSEVRGELISGINESGGSVEEATGPLGVEVRGQVPAVDEQGSAVTQPIRFVGADGPRWLLRGVLLGEAAINERAAEVFEDIFVGCIVSRGDQPMAPGDMLPLTLPDEAEPANGGEVAEDEGLPPLDPFERGPEITEIR